MSPLRSSRWCIRDKLIDGTAYYALPTSRKNLGDYRLNKGVSDEEPRYGQAQDGAGQAGDQDIKGAGF